MGPAASEAGELSQEPRLQRELTSEEELMASASSERSRTGKERAGAAKAHSEGVARKPKPRRQPGLAEAYKTR